MPRYAAALRHARFFLRCLIDALLLLAASFDICDAFRRFYADAFFFRFSMLFHFLF